MEQEGAGGGREASPPPALASHLADRRAALQADAAGRVVFLDAGARALLPAPAGGADWLGRDLADCLGEAAQRGVFLPAPDETLAALGERLARPGRTRLAAPGGRWLESEIRPVEGGGLTAVYEDVTEHVRREEDLLRAKVALEAALDSRRWREGQAEIANARLDAALAGMSQGLCLFDADSRLVVANGAFCALFEIPHERLFPGLPLRKLAALSLRAGNHAALAAEAAPEEAAALLTGAQAEAAIRDRVLAVQRRPVSTGDFVVTYEDITERRRAQDRIAFLAHHDPLTGLPNRALFTQKYQAALADDSRGFALMCLDLDRFKAVNDTLGHGAGDLLLRQVSARLLACARTTDTVARLGGDEFVVIQAGLREVAHAEVMARRIVAALAEPFDLDGARVQTGTSIGVCVARAGEPRGDMMEQADRALYRAKRGGKGSFRFFDPELDARPGGAA